METFQKNKTTQIAGQVVKHSVATTDILHVRCTSDLTNAFMEGSRSDRFQQLTATEQQSVENYSPGTLGAGA